jgi:hypothetical protein
MVDSVHSRVPLGLTIDVLLSSALEGGVLKLWSLLTLGRLVVNLMTQWRLVISQARRSVVILGSLRGDPIFSIVSVRTA